ncbi:hypothetical protein LIER_03189 [Lithospermum erythrorhizon]|uniref:Uncharacterized protein n=1 Tax=Lithospermum erythrorhizon TaxID=34254 RepID=A0AAV3NTI8_LITER
MANMDVTGTSQQPPINTQIQEFPMEDIRDEVKRIVRLAREREIQRQVNQILERDRLVREESERLNETAAHAEEKLRRGESHYTEDPPYTPTYSPLYTSSMFPQYGDTRTASYRPSIVQQTVPPVNSNAILLQELLAVQKIEFD